MPQVIDGEDWKHRECGYAAERHSGIMPRARQQSAANASHATGGMTREQWSSEFDRLSGLDANGLPIEINHSGPKGNP